jgi:hypothetical protein
VWELGEMERRGGRPATLESEMATDEAVVRAAAATAELTTHLLGPGTAPPPPFSPRTRARAPSSSTSTPAAPSPLDLPRPSLSAPKSRGDDDLGAWLTQCGLRHLKRALEHAGISSLARAVTMSDMTLRTLPLEQFHIEELSVALAKLRGARAVAAAPLPTEASSTSPADRRVSPARASATSATRSTAKHSSSPSTASPATNTTTTTTNTARLASSTSSPPQQQQGAGQLPARLRKAAKPQPAARLKP